MSYESENWARLSPRFREAHNRLLVTRGESPIPPPKVDLYTGKPPALTPADIRRFQIDRPDIIRPDEVMA